MVGTHLGNNFFWVEFYDKKNDYEEAWINLCPLLKTFHSSPEVAYWDLLLHLKQGWRQIGRDRSPTSQMFEEFDRFKRLDQALEAAPKDDESTYKMFVSLLSAARNFRYIDTPEGNLSKMEDYEFYQYLVKRMFGFFESGSYLLEQLVIQLGTSLGWLAGCIIERESKSSKLYDQNIGNYELLDRLVTDMCTPHLILINSVQTGKEIRDRLVEDLERAWKTRYHGSYPSKGNSDKIFFEEKARKERKKELENQLKGDGAGLIHWLVVFVPIILVIYWIGRH
jgi:hypothetical protein